MLKLLVLLLMISGWVMAAAAVHVVRTPTTFLTFAIVPKNDITFTDTYADTRTWTMADVPAHRELVRRIIASNKCDVLNHLTDAKSTFDLPTQLSDAIGRASNNPTENSAAAMNAALAQLKAGRIRTDGLAKMMAGAK